MTPILIIVGVFAWGCVVGAILCFLCFARYSRELHARLVVLETPHVDRQAFAKVAALMEADDEFADTPPVTH
jgi:hypothetical protein